MFGFRFSCSCKNLSYRFISNLFLRLKEVRSKISILLETNGGILFSLEGFQKMLITIWNFTQGESHSTGGIQISFLGVYNSTGGIQLSFQGVYNSTGGIQISFLGVYNSTGGIQLSFQGVYNSTRSTNLHSSSTWNSGEPREILNRLWTLSLAIFISSAMHIQIP